MTGYASSQTTAQLVPLTRPGRQLSLTIDGEQVSVAEGSTILDACARLGKEIPTLCYIKTLHPVNVCRICVVEVEGARVLVPSCSRAVEEGMVVHSNSPRVKHARKLVLEMLGSSVDLSTTPKVAAWMEEYEADPTRFGPAAPAAQEGEREAAQAGHHHPPSVDHAATVHQPVKVDNDLYVRDYAKCILCYRCVEACGPDHQNSYAISVAGRGFDAHIATEFNVALPDSACVFCGNCIAVCPTGALMPKREFDLRAEGTYDEGAVKTTDTICPYCGVGCTLTLHVLDGEIVKATSPLDHDVTLGNLCIKGRFGWRFVHGGLPSRGASATRDLASRKSGPSAGTPDPSSAAARPRSG